MDTWPLGSTIFKTLGMATRVWGSVSFLCSSWNQVSHPEGEADIVTRGVSWKRDA